MNRLHNFFIESTQAEIFERIEEKNAALLDSIQKAVRRKENSSFRKETVVTLFDGTNRSSSPSQIKSLKHFEQMTNFKIEENTTTSYDAARDHYYNNIFVVCS